MSKPKSTPMTRSRASAIQSASAKQSGSKVRSGSFVSRAQRAAAKNSK